MAIADKLTELQATKTAIKTAIENKGQDLDGVPFTEYASKIDAIQGGSGEDAEIIAGFTTRTDMSNMFYTCSEMTIVPEMDTSKVTNMSSMFRNCSKITTIPKIDTRKVLSMSNMFQSCSKLIDVPTLDTSSVVQMGYMFHTCFELKTIPMMDTRNCTNMGYMVQLCPKLTTFPELDARNATTLQHIFYGCTELTTCGLRNIKVDLQVGSGTSWGHKLTRESALHLCKECRTTTSARTLTFATAVYNDLETLYVKLVPITEEMRAEDDLIDEKLPFELCESTDDGAMTIASYMTLKNWAIAK